MALTLTKDEQAPVQRTAPAWNAGPGRNWPQAAKQPIKHKATDEFRQQNWTRSERERIELTRISLNVGSISKPGTPFMFRVRRISCRLLSVNYNYEPFEHDGIFKSFALYHGVSIVFLGEDLKQTGVVSLASLRRSVSSMAERHKTNDLPTLSMTGYCAQRLGAGCRLPEIKSRFLFSGLQEKLAKV